MSVGHCCVLSICRSALLSSLPIPPLLLSPRLDVLPSGTDPQSSLHRLQAAQLSLPTHSL